MIEPAHTFEHAGLTVRIVPEEYVDENDDPRRNQDGNIGQMFCAKHSGYTLGDEDAEDPRDQVVTCERCGGSGDDPDGHYIVVDAAAYGRHVIKTDFTTLQRADAYIDREQPEGQRWISEIQSCPICEGEGEIELSPIDWLRDVKKARVALPLFLYDHSGLSMSCGANLLTGADDFSRSGRRVEDGHGWDVSAIGVIYFDPELAERWGRPETDDEQIEKELRAEVKEYDAYLRGDVYGFEIVGDDDEVLDSCWGYLEAEHAPWSSEAYVVQEAKEVAEHCAAAIEREQAEAHRWACADVVTV